VNSYRVGEKVKQKLIANIGRLDELFENGDIETFITNLSRILEEEKGNCYVDVTNKLLCEDVFEYGMPYILTTLWNRTGLKKILLSEFEKLKGKDRAKREVEAIFEMVLARLTDPKSKLATFNEWRDKYYFGEEEILSETLDLHDYYRAMDTLSETLEHIEESLFYERRNLFSDTELVFLDTTSTYFEGNGEDNGIGKYVAWPPKSGQFVLKSYIMQLYSFH
jgi:hypothetical protein